MENLQREENILGKHASRYYVEVEDMQSNVEAYYFWFIDFFKGEYPSGVGFPNVLKIRDVFTATESSTFFGNQEQRKAIQQDRISTFMATIGQMIRDVFKMVRELRILDERLTYYKDSEFKDENGKKKTGTDLEKVRIADNSLKDMWTSMVEGGGENPSSIYGMARTVNFVTLPDLFFSVMPESEKDINKEVNAIKGTNNTVKNALKRKLLQFMTWRTKTYKEISTRRSFLVKYLRQHYNTIRMYMAWIKPHLKNVKKLQMSQEDHVELVTSFESSVIELELMAVKGDFPETPEALKAAVEKNPNFKSTVYFPCILLQLDHVVRPMMAFQQEQQRSAIHAGKVVMHMKSYGLTYDQIQEYKKEVEMEDFDLINSVKEAMDSLKDDLKHYLDEAEMVKPKKNKEDEKPTKKPSMFTPISSVFKSFQSMVTPAAKKSNDYKKGQDSKKSLGDAKLQAWIAYDIFKKVHGLLAW
ncbi:hypothetical protein CL622_07280 [archaeon]|nr:hypothetical protein [archaeon]|tara:strand:+ start:2269 stop:3681 length:1413 start_codon:yes stop_codon:yes gene_type:complete